MQSLSIVSCTSSVLINGLVARQLTTVCPVSGVCQALCLVWEDTNQSGGKEGLTLNEHTGKTWVGASCSGGSKEGCVLKGDNLLRMTKDVRKQHLG